MKQFQREDVIYYKVEFSSSQEVAEHGEDAKTEEVTFSPLQFSHDRIEYYAKKNGWDTVKITKCQEFTTWYSLEESEHAQ